MATKSKPSSIVLALLTVLAFHVSALTDPKLPIIFYPFGSDVGDSVVPVSDEGYSTIVTSNDFQFFNSNIRTIYVTTDGAITFDGGGVLPERTPFPIEGRQIIAPYWIDVDTTGNDGRVYFRETTDSALIDRAASDIQSAFGALGFNVSNARWLFVATWHNVTYHNGDTDAPTQSFQAVLMADGTNSFALFHYGNLTWTKPPEGNVSAQMGFCSGVRSINFYDHPLSRSNDIIDLFRTTNVGMEGRWAFRLDKTSIAAQEYSTEAPGAGVLDGCSSNPCLNNGSCSAGIENYTCSCVTGYTGVNCQTDIDDCFCNPCLNNGTCVDGRNQYMCNCVAGYTGINCQTDIDECAFNPCMNNGTCIDGINKYTCICAHRYRGLRCQVDIGICSSQPCMNVSTCTGGRKQNTCYCAGAYYYELTPMIDLDHCNQRPCLNDSACDGGISHYWCTSIGGYSGLTCRIDVDECNPCFSGSCYVNTCTCVPSDYYPIPHCVTDDVDECSSNPCLNDGTCVDGRNQYSCTCAAGFTGPNCQTGLAQRTTAGRTSATRPLSISISSAWRPPMWTKFDLLSTTTQPGRNVARTFQTSFCRTDTTLLIVICFLFIFTH